MSTSASESSTPPVQSQQQQDSSTPQENSNSESGSNSDCSTFECNICLETAGQPVITMCGHLFCWPCIYKWMQLHLDNPQCPVCKSALSMDKLIPLYGRGKDQTDPRTKIPDIPNRPPGQHAESQPHQYQPQFGFFHGGGTPLAPAQYGNISFSAGIGFFPSLFGLQFTYPTPYGNNGNAAPHEQEPQALLSRLLFMLAMLVLFFLLFF